MNASGDLDQKLSTQFERMDYLDGWRGLAIILVLQSHFLGISPVETGRLGVDVFFCLSGFLMSGLLFIQRQPLASFYRRRISRILPAFVTFVVAIFALGMLQGKVFAPSEMLSTLLFMRTYLPVEPNIWKSAIPIGHLWSLNVEEHGYIFMSGLVLLPLARRREGFLLVLSGVTCIAVGFLYLRLGGQIPLRAEVGTEVVASHLFISAGYRLLKDRFVPHVPHWLPIASLVAAVACYSDVMPWWGHRLLSPFLLAFTVNHLSDTGKVVKSLLASTPMRYMGLWSFSIYIWQQPFYSAIGVLPGGAATAFILAMVVSLLSFYVLEKPSRTWLNKHWKGRSENVRTSCEALDASNVPLR